MKTSTYPKPCNLIHNSTLGCRCNECYKQPLRHQTVHNTTPTSNYYQQISTQPSGWRQRRTWADALASTWGCVSSRKTGYLTLPKSVNTPLTYVYRHPILLSLLSQCINVSRWSSRQQKRWRSPPSPRQLNQPLNKVGSSSLICLGVEW